MNSFQEIFGPPSAGAANKVVDYMTDWVQGYIRHAPFAVLASADPNGNCDASPKGGKPGFIKVLDERHLLIPDVAGNRLFQSYDNMSQNPRIGLLFMIPGVDSTARVNGLISQRRGQILGFDARDGWPGWDVVAAHIPEAEMQDLIVELRSATSGVGTFTAHFDHLAEVTGKLVDQVLAAHKAAAE